MRVIDADAFKRGIKEQRLDNFALVYDIYTVMDFIDNAPTLDVVPVRHGKWIEGWNEYCICCSVCGSDFMEENANWSYCPECGAKMDAK